jgi:DNA-binding transcriptional MocR family regulator
VVENGVYDDLMPEADRPPPLHALAPEQTYHLTSFTKGTVSGLRAGYLAAPARAVPRLTTRVRATSWMATPLAAEIAARWIEDGTADELIAWQRAELRARHAVLDRVLKGFDLARHPCSLHAWLTLPDGWRAEAFVGQARLRGVAVTPAEPFVVGRQPQPHAVRISLGPPASVDELERGLTALAEVLRDSPEPAFVAI